MNRTVGPHRDRDVFDELAPDGFYVFVPAIMSVGILFSITTLLRDLFRWTGRRSRARSSAVAIAATVDDMLSEIDPELRFAHPVAPKRIHLVAGLGFVATSGFVAAAAFIGYAADDSHTAWLLALWVVAALVFGWLGFASLALWRVWPRIPWWTMTTVRTLRLGAAAHEGSRPGGFLTSAVVTTATLVVALTGLIRHDVGPVEEIDGEVLSWFVGLSWLDNLDGLDVFGMTVFSVGFVVLIGLSAFRCRVMALVYPTAFVFAWVATTSLQEIVARVRPNGFGQVVSYPSGHVVQAVFLAGLVPTAVYVLLNVPKPAVRVLQLALGVLALATAAFRIHHQDHWPLDAAGGLLLGLAVVLATHWVLAHSWWHQACSSCPWSDHPGHMPWGQGLFVLRDSTLRRLRIAGPAGALGASVLLGLATLTIGVPQSPEGDGMDTFLAEPIQLGLAALTAVSGLVAMRWRAVGAFMIALCATGLALLASVEYRPVASFVLAVLLLVPAVLTWLAWQKNETVGALAALATITVGSLTGTAFGARQIFRHYYGPTHPESIAAELDSDADWLWLGGVSTQGATVVAGGFDPGEEVTLEIWPTASSDRTVETLVRAADVYGLARFELNDLRPATGYAYEVTERDDRGDDLADARFSTFAPGPQHLVIVTASCARNESNGAVFDAISAADPDLFLMLGDLNYADLTSTDPADFVRQFGRSLSQPGQAAVYSQIPNAYVWDDHDFGPNDADSTSPTRDAASAAYRAAVPDYGVDDDPTASIAQAFSIGRVRFILTDTRSHRTDSTMLGTEQLAWFLDELVASSATHALVVWGNPTPWIASDGPGSDNWSAYPTERTLIADTIAAAGIDNLIMVSGDAHMVALDDGTNSDYSTLGYPGFPVLHGAPLDRPGHVKGGPYSHGTFPGSGQFARVEVFDDGGTTVTVRLSGLNWRGEELVSYELEM